MIQVYILKHLVNKDLGTGNEKKKLMKNKLIVWEQEAVKLKEDD